MQLFKSIGEWLVSQILDGLKKPIEEMQKSIDKQADEIESIKKDVQSIRESDKKQLAYDLAFGENTLCHHINKALARGYMTEDEQRNIPNMYDKYTKLGGNHGAELAYSKFCDLPTKAEYERGLYFRNKNTEED